MLSCAGCGEPVSEWAARCPACRHTTGDAVEDGSGGPGPAARRRAAPRRAVLVAAVLVAAAAVTVAVITGSGGSPAQPALPAPPPLGGLVLARSPDGLPFVARPDGRDRRALPVGPLRPGDTSLLVAGDGLVVAARPAGGSPYIDVRRLALPGGTTLAGAEPLSDRGRAVVVRAGPAADGKVSARPLSGGPAVSLGGSADDVAGDPSSLGAFVAVTSGRPGAAAEPWQSAGPPDSRVELRRSSGPAELLATAAQLNRDCGQPADQPAHLTVFPSPDGQKVAVMLNPISGGGSDSPMVILSRHGRVLASVGAGSGPIGYSTAYWSPDGASLAYASFGTGGTDLAVLTGTDLATQGFQPDTTVAGCTWSPDGAWILCLASTSYTSDWVLARNTATLEPIYSFPLRLVSDPASRAPSLDAPLDWLP